MQRGLRCGEGYRQLQLHYPLPFANFMQNLALLLGLCEKKILVFCHVILERRSCSLRFLLSKTQKPCISHVKDGKSSKDTAACVMQSRIELVFTSGYSIALMELLYF